MIPQLNSFSNFGYLVYLVVAVTLVVAASEDDKVRFHYFDLGIGLYVVLKWFISFCSLLAAEIGDKCTNHPMSMRN